MRTLWATLAMMVVTTGLIFGVPMLFQPEFETRTIALNYQPHEGGPAGDATTEPTEPAPAPWAGIAAKALDHVQELFWALVQAVLIARYVKKRG